MSAAIGATMGVIAKVGEMGIPMAQAVVGKLVQQIHAGVKVQAHVEFDGPGPFDANVDLKFEGRLDEGHFKIKELHIVPSSPR